MVGSLIHAGEATLTGASAHVNFSIVSSYLSFSLFGRTANFLVSIPYGNGNFHGTVVGAETLAYRSGLLPATFRFSVNLIGGRAMDLAEFMKWRQKTILGISLRLVPETGQYDPTKLINFVTNRWSFKPDLGYSHPWG